MPIRVPTDATIRLQHERGAWIVAITRAGGPDTIPKLADAGGALALLTHDPGMCWPDREGEALADAVLAQPGGAAFMAFEALADALACRKRLEGGAA